jgi:hypothetical protein
MIGHAAIEDATAAMKVSTKHAPEADHVATIISIPLLRHGCAQAALPARSGS